MVMVMVIGAGGMEVSIVRVPEDWGTGPDMP